MMEKPDLSKHSVKFITAGENTQTADIMADSFDYRDGILELFDGERCVAMFTRAIAVIVS